MSVGEAPKTDRTPATAREFLLLVGGSEHDLCTIAAKVVTATAVEIHCTCGARILLSEDDLVVEHRSSMALAKLALRNVPEVQA